MKTNIILVILHFFLSTCLAQEDKKAYILVSSVDLYINTSSRVSCENFETVFGKMTRLSLVTQSDSLMLFSSFIRKIKYAKRNRQIDVRCKYFYKSENNDAIVCTNGLSIIVNGKLIKRNKKFLSLLNSLVHKN